MKENQNKFTIKIFFLAFQSHSNVSYTITSSNIDLSLVAIFSAKSGKLFGRSFIHDACKKFYFADEKSSLSFDEKDESRLNV